MDDKIRKAAEEYPLKIEGKDWDKVAGAMQSTAEMEEPGKSKEYWWLLLLLLPLMLAVPYMNKNTQRPLTYSNTNKTEETTEKQNSAGPLNKNDELNRDNKTTEQVASGINPGQQMNEAAGEEKQNGSQQNKQFSIKKESINNSNNISVDHNHNNTKENIAKSSNTNNNTTSDKDLAINNSAINSNKNNKNQKSKLCFLKDMINYLNIQ